MDGDGVAPVQLDRSGLGALVEQLKLAGYQVVGPTVRENAIVLAELNSADELPRGWGVDTGPGTYRLRQRADGAAFGHVLPAAGAERLGRPLAECRVIVIGDTPKDVAAAKGIELGR